MQARHRQFRLFSNCPVLSGFCSFERCRLKEIKESDLVFFACSAYRYSQPIPHCVRRYIMKRNKFNGTRNSQVVQWRQGIWLSEPPERRDAFVHFSANQANGFRGAQEDQAVINGPKSFQAENVQIA